MPDPMDHLIEAQAGYFAGQWLPSLMQDPEYLALAPAQQEWAKHITYQSYLFGIALARRGAGLTP